jgi:hypothetical protein
MPYIQTYRLRVIVLALIAMLVVVACAPDNLDITPSPTSTAVPSPTPSPTPLPEGFEAEVDQNEAVLGALVELLPNSIPAGAAQWKWDYSRAEDGIEDLLNVTNGIGHKIYFNEQTGGQMSLSFAVFDTSEDALANYERIKDIRSVLDTGDTDADFSEPNIFGAGLYGSVAIFQIDNYFIEVSIELFSSTGGNPLVPLSRAAIRFFEENRDTFEAVAGDDSADAGSGATVLDAVLENIPNEINTSTQWRRDFTRFDGVETPPNVDNGTAFRVFYKDQTANAFNMTFGEFDSAEDALAHYEKIKGIREGIEDENTIEDFPQPHVIGRGLYGSVALFAIDEFFIEILIERAPGTSANPTESIARKALALLDTVREE